MSKPKSGFSGCNGIIKLNREEEKEKREGTSYWYIQNKRRHTTLLFPTRNVLGHKKIDTKPGAAN
jgi:hypothetical protein